ncbi:Vinorine synthase-like [Melia azedarach]|uniref:Vinorine synthase-like n=1 Tax=Melia azedarach TaxID=155640 RepID=A0ACC1X440_MELAZ|nr:Vinorine synthase-like [Melia azedarach]
MVRALEVEIISRETIKPASPTPHYLRNFKLSLLDQIIPVEYTAAIFFYRKNGETAAQLSRRMKKSLSESLTSFYPLAGIIKDHLLIECNDNGAEFLEARASCFLSDILQQPDQNLVRDFLPIKIESRKAGSGPLLLVQLTTFKCGGVCVGICLSHKIADGCTATTFVKSWAAKALDSGKTAVKVPAYNAASIFPPDDSLVSHMDVTGANYVTKRFVFDAAKIAELKRKVANANVPKPSRVEAVIALVWKCTITASRSIRGFPRVSLTVHAMDLRRMVSPTLPENILGNFVGDFPAQTSKNGIELQDLIYELRKGKEEFKINGLKTILEHKSLAGNRIEGDDIDFYMYSDLSKLSQYDVDFGWGKPIWVTLPNYMHNMVMLFSTRDGEGIEALVSLKEEDMALFERDKELLAFATVNPSVLPIENKSAEDLLNL